jgi:PKD repeat protein
MYRHRTLILSVLVLIGATFLLAGAGVAVAAPPINDDIYSATPIVFTDGQFSDVIDMSEATSDPDDPAIYSCGWYSPVPAVWYTYTPTDNQMLELSTPDSTYEAVIAIFTGSPDSLTYENCWTPWVHDDVAVSAGQTYYFMVGYYNGEASGTINFVVKELAPPPNDDFANAAVVDALPYSFMMDSRGATREIDEPVSACYWDLDGPSMWFAFTPTVAGSYTSHVSSDAGWWIAAYTGSSLSELVEVGCNSSSLFTLTNAQPGTTYYFQASNISFVEGGLITFDLDVPPAPSAEFYWNPEDASMFSDVWFSDYSYDPAAVGFVSWFWNFGDGATSTERNPTHRYAKDGDFAVSLTSTTADGRTASVTKTVMIRTHDVAIKKFQTPTSAKVGQAKTITVGLINTRYPETVEVILYVSDPYGMHEIGRQTVTVLVQKPNKTTDIKFTYVFTAADAALGKVTFSAQAYIVDHQDALPADNQAISTPVKVAK